MNRRRFLDVVFGGATLGTFGALLYPLLKYLEPLKEAGAEEEIEIRPEDIPDGEAVQYVIRGRPVVVLHIEDKFKAFDPTCTHLECLVKWHKEKQVFICPCHAGAFDRDGEVIAGPPPEALRSIPLKVEEGLIKIG